MTNKNYEKIRKIMVEEQIEKRGLKNEKVLSAMMKVPRHKFVPYRYQVQAYQDSAIPIDENQTISQPYIVAKMIENLEPENNHKVLEIGTGSGYAAAVLSEICSEVYTIERHQLLAKQAQLRFESLNYDNIEIKIDDGTKGWEEKAPFDRILVSAGAPSVPKKLTDQLEIGGIMVIPVGESKRLQKLIKLTKYDENDLKIEELEHVRFVPLIGNEGWEE
ncbi:MAG: protein-L-isoaspartate(D-aspartate) O-methyltransferase [Bacillota bacterium]